MSDRIQIQITATDGASRVFQQVASGAERLDRSLDQVGDGFQDLSQDSELTAQQMREIDKLGKDIAISLGVLATGVSLAGQSFRDQEVALRALERGYGDAADEMEAFAQQIQDTTNFSNDAAIAAANTFRTLSDNYGFTSDQIQQLISISADLAATMGISLSDAAFRVQSAMRGEAEAAEFLGLTLNDRALGLDKVSTSMTEAERAQIRFNALQEQSAFAMGTAAEQADTTYGAMTQLRDSVQDAGQAFGEFLGPVGEIGAFAADNAVQIAAMGLAIGQLANTAKGLNTLTTAMTGVNVASKAMSVTLGPVGIAAAAGLAAIALYDMWQSAEGIVTPVELADAALGDLEETIRELYAAGSTLGSLGERATEGIFPDLTRDIARIEEIQNAIAQTNIAIQNSGVETEEQTANLERWSFELINLADKYGVLDASMLSATISVEDIAAGMDDLNAILSFTGAGAAQAQAETAELFDQWDRGEISAETLLEDLDVIANSFDAYNENATKSAESTTKAAAALGTWMTAGGEVVTLNDDIARSMQEMGQASVELGDVLVRSTDPFVLRQSEILAGMQEQMLLMGQMSTWDVNWAEGPSSQEVIDFDQAIAQTKATANAAQSAQEGLARGIESAADAMTYQVGESARLAAELERQAEQVARLQEEYAQTFETMQADATRASDTLDTVFGAIVGNTNAIASQAQDVADWSTSLTEATLSAEDYGTAVESNTRILVANASVQEDVLSIQAQLSPIVATATEALARQMDEIANGSTDAQLFALGMMDAATSSQALALAQGYLENQDVFGPMIQQAAELNPMLAQILEEMGLISYNPATGRVELLGADEAMSDLDRMTEAMDGLNHSVLTLVAILDDDQFTNSAADVEAKLAGLDAAEATSTVNADTSNAESGFALANELIGTWDSSSGTADMNVNDNASGAIYAAIGALNSLDGMVANSYINTYVTTISSFIGSGTSPLGNGHGGIAGYAAGGVVAEMAEWGPELLHFPNGGVALARNRGIYTVPQGTYVDTAPATAYKLGSNIGVTVNINGPSSWDDAAAQVSRKIVPAIARAIREHERSLGAY